MIKKALEIIVILIIIAILVFAGYQGFLMYQKWQDNQKSNELKLIETLQANQGTIIRLTTELAEIEKRVVTDTLKEKVVIKEEAPTYEGTKEELIVLREDPIVNAEKIEVKRVEFEERINEFQASPDKILINTGEEKIILYEDTEGNLVSLESGITITRHRKIEEVIADLEDFKLIAGGDIGYEIKDNLELGFGYNTNKEFYLKLQYSF